MDDKSMIQINQRFAKLETLMIKILDLIDPDHDHNPLLVQSRSNDHDPREEVPEFDNLLSWFKSECLTCGIDPEGRDLNSIKRNITFFYRKRETISNKERYIMKFIPGKQQPKLPDPEDASRLIFGFTPEYIDSLRDEVNEEVYSQVCQENETCRKLFKSYELTIANTMHRRILIGKACELGILPTETIFKP